MHKSGPVANDKNKLLLPELSRFFGLKRERDEVVGKRLKVEIKRDRGDKEVKKKVVKSEKFMKTPPDEGQQFRIKKNPMIPHFFPPY